MKATQLALKHKDREVRLAVMKGLGQGHIGHPIIVRALLRSLRTDPQTVAAKILELFNFDSIIEPLESFLKIDTEIKGAAVKTLGRLEIKDEALLSQVLVALNRCLYYWSGTVNGEVLISMRQLLNDRRLPS